MIDPGKQGHWQYGRPGDRPTRNLCGSPVCAWNKSRYLTIATSIMRGHGSTIDCEDCKRLYPLWLLEQLDI